MLVGSEVLTMVPSFEENFHLSVSVDAKLAVSARCPKPREADRVLGLDFHQIGRCTFDAFP